MYRICNTYCTAVTKHISFLVRFPDKYQSLKERGVFSGGLTQMGVTALTKLSLSSLVSPI